MGLNHKLAKQWFLKEKKNTVWSNDMYVCMYNEEPNMVVWLGNYFACCFHKKNAVTESAAMPINLN